MAGVLAASSKAGFVARSCRVARIARSVVSISWSMLSVSIVLHLSWVAGDDCMDLSTSSCNQEIISDSTGSKKDTKVFGAPGSTF